MTAGIADTSSAKLGRKTRRVNLQRSAIIVENGSSGLTTLATDTDIARNLRPC
jgi:hypothetical protein